MFVFVLVFGLALAAGAAADADEELWQIQQRIARMGYEWTAGWNPIWDLSAEEKDALKGLRVPPGGYLEPAADPAIATRQFDSRFDWRERGGVTPIRDQGNCGSCWAFSILAAIEAKVLIYQGWSPDLSEQAMMSCNTYGYDCDGGWFDVNDDLIRRGPVEESCMPYQARNNVPCAQDACAPVVWPSSWRFIAADINSIKAALDSGPVPCAMTIANDLYSYNGGCYQNPTTAAVNHGVVIVGWDDVECGGVWIVKNSWGTRWGENGFLKIRYGSCRIGYGAHVIDIPHSAPPTPTPVPEPTPPPTGFSASVTTYARHFVPGQAFQLDLFVDNYLGYTVGADLYVMLDVYGARFFFPTWDRSPVPVRRYYQGGENWERLLDFVWPQGAGSGSGILFWAALLEPGTLDLITYSRCSFAFSP